MDAARKKVTEISQFARARGKNGGGAHGPLDDCREISVTRLGEALNQCLGLMVGQLVGMADKAADPDLYYLYIDALELARDRAGPVGESFREHYLWRFNREARREGGCCADGLNAELSLLEPDDLEETLAAGTLANAIFNACSEELFGLGKRMGLLINDPDLLKGDNPLGPETIAAAVMEALESQAPRLKVRLLLVSLLSRHLPERVRDIYRNINARLVERNVLPTIRVGMKRAEPGHPVPMAAQGQAVETAGDLFSLMQQLMQSHGGIGGTGAPVIGMAPIQGPAMPGEVAVNDGVPLLHPGTFLHVLDQLQHGSPEGLARAGIDAACLNGGRADLLRDLRGGDLAGMMTPLDTMTLDIVAMVFDYIFDDERIPDAIKALIGRLQIPVLKVAMLDKGFFSQKAHPARRLLDGLAEAAVGWDPEEGHEGGLYRRIEQLVDDVQTRFSDDFGVFESALAGLQAYLEDERQAADRQAALSALAVRNREAADLAWQVARDEIETALLGRTVPAPIRAFLTEHWLALLADLHQKVGIGGEAWKGALATMNDLVWSVAAKSDAVARKRLVEMLPGLLKRLDEGVRCLGLAEAERNAFFSNLVKCHAEAVKAGLSAIDQAAEASVGTDFYGDIPTLAHLDEFEPVEPVAELAPEIAEMTLRALAWRDNQLPVPDVTLAGLKRGSWIAYRQEDGTEVRAKLSWISPRQGLYLFTNRQGQRAMSINAEGLASKLNAGEVRVLDAAPLMERAVGNLLESLKRNAA